MERGRQAGQAREAPIDRCAARRHQQTGVLWSRESRVDIPVRSRFSVHASDSAPLLVSLFPYQNSSDSSPLPCSILLFILIIVWKLKENDAPLDRINQTIDEARSHSRINRTLSK